MKCGRRSAVLGSQAFALGAVEDRAQAALKLRPVCSALEIG